MKTLKISSILFLTEAIEMDFSFILSKSFLMEREVLIRKM
jgi:hypothetical protein